MGQSSSSSSVLPSLVDLSYKEGMPHQRQRSNSFKIATFREALGEVVGELELLVVGVLAHFHREEGPVASVARYGRLDVARVLAAVDVLQRGKVQITIVGHERARVLLHKVRENVAHLKTKANDRFALLTC